MLGRRIEIDAVRADGTEILVELAITAFRIAEEPAFTAYLRDITERVRSERRRAAQYGVSSLLAGSETLSAAGPQIIQAIAASGSWTCGAIWLRDDAEDRLECAVTWEEEGTELEAFSIVSRATRLAGARGLPGQVATSRKPIWVPDVRDDPHFVRSAAAGSANLRGAFAFPLSADGTVNGVLELFSPSIADPDEDLLQMVEALGSQIGLFIQRRKVEQELQAQKEAAEAANAAKDRFLATLSHELRTPLTPVLIWAGDTLHQPGLAPEIEEGLEMICRNIELEARLIDDLLDLTRIARGKLELHLRKADAHELLRHAIDITRSEIDSRKLTLDLHFDATNPILRVDPPRLQQVFWNVLRNASKFTREHGIISVCTFNPSPAQLSIRISDTGIGIEPQYLDTIFDAFEQVGARREGLGLGLAISKAVVDMHRGRIQAFSAGTGKGASFLIELETEKAA